MDHYDCEKQAPPVFSPEKCVSGASGEIYVGSNRVEPPSAFVYRSGALEMTAGDVHAICGVGKMVAGLQKRLSAAAIAVEVLDPEDRVLVVVAGGEYEGASVAVDEVLKNEYRKLPPEQRARVFVSVDLSLG